MIAFLVGIFIVRLTGIGATIVSLAFLVIIHSLFLYRTDIFKGNQAFFGIPQLLTLTSAVILAVMMVFVVRGFRESRWGIALRASADDEIGAYAAAICVTPVAMKAISLPDAPWGLNGFELHPVT